jgi:lipopolysaccharide transport system permease protein
MGRGLVSHVMTDVTVHSARPAPIGALLNPARTATNLWRLRSLVWQFAVRYFQQRYRGTYLGTAWALLHPLVSLLVFTFVFGMVLSARFGTNPDQPRSHYAVLLFASMTVFGVFVESVVRSCSLVVENPSYVRKVVFPVEVLPAAQVVASSLFGLFGIALTLAATWVVFGRVPWTAVLFPVVMLPMLALGLGLAWFFASLCVFVRDAGNMVSIVLSTLLIFVTPVFFGVEQYPEQWRWVAEVNPLTPVIDGARRVLVLGEMPDFPGLGVVMLAGLVAAQLGYGWFMKSRRGFADVL